MPIPVQWNWSSLMEFSHILICYPHLYFVFICIALHSVFEPGQHSNRKLKLLFIIKNWKNQVLSGGLYLSQYRKQENWTITFSDSWWSEKHQNQWSRTGDMLLCWQNLPPTLPIMQLNHSALSQRFGCVTLELRSRQWFFFHLKHLIRLHTSSLSQFYPRPVYRPSGCKIAAVLL